MLFNHYSNHSFDLANTPLVAFYKTGNEDKGEALYDLGFGGEGDNSRYGQSAIDKVINAVKEYSAQNTDAYHWLFSNIAINLDRVCSVGVYDNQLKVAYPGGVFTSSKTADAKNIYQGYLDAVQERKAKLSRKFATAADIEQAPVPAAEKPVMEVVLINPEAIKKLANFNGF